MRGGDKGERRNNHFPAEVGRANGDFERGGSIAHGYAVANTADVRYLPFELLHFRSIIGQPPSFQHTAYTLQQALGIRHIGPADMNLMEEKPSSAEQGEVTQGRFLLP
jgi:hypothetical protein